MDTIVTEKYGRVSSCSRRRPQCANLCKLSMAKEIPTCPVQRMKRLMLTQTKESSKRRNALAMVNLSMAFTTDGSMQPVCKAMTEEWPNGSARLVVDGLFKMYGPQDSITQVEIRQRLNRVSIKVNDDPTTLFEQLSKPIQLTGTHSRRAIAHCSGLGCIHKGDELDIGSPFESIMNKQWRQCHGDTSQINDNEIKVVFAAFVGTCYRCRQKGHKANNCPTKPKGGKETGKFKTL
jgi:hypothetical protein